MMNKREFRNKLLFKLNRIDHKCDIIISELRAQRELLSPRHDAVDDAIDRLHEAARSLREQSSREKRHLRNKFGL